MTDHQLDPAVVTAARERLEARRAQLQLELRASPIPTEGARSYTEQLSGAMDEAIVTLHGAALEGVRLELGEAAHTEAAALAVIAVGGYGRSSLCPASDVDLLFLNPGTAPEEVSPPLASLIDRLLYALWDLGIELGQATRTLQQCLDIADSDQSAKTGLVDARRVAGDASGALFGTLRQAVLQKVLSGTGANVFIEQKLTEARARDERFGGTIYLLEPEVKSGQGGVRELHTALWVADARWHTKTVSGLLHIGVLSSRERRALERATEFMLRVRSELHLISGRRREVLGFEHQESIAKTLGYTEHGARNGTKVGTERFMRAYYFHASQNRRIAQLIIERAMHHPRRKRATSGMVSGFKTFDGMLTIDREQVTRDPSLLVRIFAVAAETGRPIYSFSKELIGASLGLIDRDVRRRPQVVRDLLTLLDRPGTPDDVLDLMHEVGLLRRLIPEFSRVHARWQHSLYHVYTVDVHSLFVVKNLKRLRDGRAGPSFTEQTRRFTELPRPSVLYLAGLLHDVGKGYKRGDHSVRGAKVARTVGTRLEAAGLSRWRSGETEDLVWLVRDHLLLSDTSQRRDLSDPELIASVAEQVRDLERLTMLWLLTVADMQATSPKVWTSWKGALLQELFSKVRVRLQRSRRDRRTTGTDFHLATRRARMADEIAADCELRGTAPPSPALLAAFVAAVPDRYILTVDRARMAEHARGWARVRDNDAHWIRIEHHRSEGYSELTVLCPDRPGLLAMLSGAVAANGFSILAAQVFSVELAPGRRAALDQLQIANADAHARERFVQLRADLRAVLEHDHDVEALLERRLMGSTLVERPMPSVETKVKIDLDASSSDTVIDVFCRDHLGALHTIARALSDQGLSINLAKISTQGHRVADGFYVTDVVTQERIESAERLRAIAEAVRVAIDASVASSAASSTSSS